MSHSIELRRAHVAVIGAGPAGIAVSRELLKEGHTVTIFEADDGVGGAWRFDGTATDSDLLGLDDSRVRVHSSMYPGLRTNLPRQVMSLCDFPFSTQALGPRAHDPRPYPLHSEVLAFCEALADAAGLREHLVLNTRVLRVDPVLQNTTADGNLVPPQCLAPKSADRDVTAGVQDAAAVLADGQPLGKQAGLKWRVLTATVSTGSAAASQGVPAAPDGNIEATADSSCVSSTSFSQEQGHSEQQQQQQQQPQDGEKCVAGVVTAAPATQQHEWLFDAVASCVGTFSEISLPKIPGMATWPGLQLHSHNFRGAQQFKGQKVMVVGASFSGEEIARHIANHAREVLHCARTFTGPGTAREPHRPQEQLCTGGSSSCSCRTNTDDILHNQQNPGQEEPQQQPKLPEEQQQLQQPQGPIPQPAEPRPNITRLPMLQELLPDGSAVLVGGRVVTGLDAVVYCTGYRVTLPWLDHLGLLETDNACVRPLHAHMFVPSVGPSLALCGLPWRCAKFPQFQLQGQLLARLLSGRARLPSQQEMQQEQQQLFAAMQVQGIPLRYTHCMASFMPQDEFAYAEQLVWLAAGQQRDVQDNKQHLQEQLLLQQQQVQTQLQQHSRDGMLQQPQSQLVSFPGWLKALAKAVAGDILGRPDTFRDQWGENVAELMAAADTAMQDLLVPADGTQPPLQCS